MNDFITELSRRLLALREQDLHRELRRVDSPQGTQLQLEHAGLLNFSSNDYLGLANHPRLKEAAAKAVEQFGAGSGASRLVCGSLAPHHELESAIAHFKGTEAAISFSSGYAAALGTICALVGAGDVIVLDKLVHASIVDAARLSQAKLRIFPHNDLHALEEILHWARLRTADADGPRGNILVVTESVFSMDGDQAPLQELVALKEKYGAWLMVDEAHATGILGTHRRGLAEAQGVEKQIDVHMGTLGKALGAAGGYICGSQVLIDYLVNRARSFIFSTAPVPAAAAAARAGIELVQSNEGAALCDLLWNNISWLKRELAKAGWPVDGIKSAIFPLVLGSEAHAITTARNLREQGIFIPAIRYPTVARGGARLRLTLSASHTHADLERLVAALRGVSGHSAPDDSHA